MVCAAGPPAAVVLVIAIISGKLNGTHERAVQLPIQSSDAGCATVIIIIMPQKRPESI